MNDAPLPRQPRLPDRILVALDVTGFDTQLLEFSHQVQRGAITRFLGVLRDLVVEDGQDPDAPNSVTALATQVAAQWTTDLGDVTSGSGQVALGQAQAWRDALVLQGWWSPVWDGSIDQQVSAQLQAMTPRERLELIGYDLVLDWSETRTPDGVDPRGATDS